MNVIDLLKKDHQTVSQLFKSYESVKEGHKDGSRQEIAQEICRELTVHATVEEELFYPAVDAKAQSDDEDAEEKVKEADEEHRLVKALVAEIESMKEDEDHFDAKMKVLKDVVEHHVEEEEGELMPKARKLINKEELETIGAEAESRKEELKAATATPKVKAAPRNRKATGGAPGSVQRARSGGAKASSSRSTTR